MALNVLSIDDMLPMQDTPHIVKPQKNSPQPVTKAIRLKPSLADYATFVGTTGPASRKTKPNQWVLAVAKVCS
jgi:hypothetical protein